MNLYFTLLGIILMMIMIPMNQAERLIVYSNDHKAGLSDRYFILTTLRSWAKIYDANLSFPRPCQALSQEHSSYIVNCSVGWDRYIEVDPPFEGYYSEPRESSISNKCQNWILFAEDTAREFFNRPKDEVRNSSFCLNIKMNFYGAIPWLGAILGKAHIPFTWNEFHASPAAFPNPSKQVVSSAEKLLHGTGVTNNNYGILKIRRGDYSIHGKMAECTKIEEVLHTWSSVLNDYYHLRISEIGSPPSKVLTGLGLIKSKTDITISSILDEIPKVWLIFGDVENGYWPTFKTIFTKLAHAPIPFGKKNNNTQPLITFVQRFIVEKELKFAGKSLTDAFPDNYFLYSIIMHLIRSTRFSIGGHGEGNLGDVCYPCQGGKFCSGWTFPGMVQSHLHSLTV